MSLMEKVETALKLQGGSKSAVEIASQVEPILEKIKSGEFDATDIITHKLSLEEGRHAYEIFDAKEDNCIKVVLKP